MEASALTLNLSCTLSMDQRPDRPSIDPESSARNQSGLFPGRERQDSESKRQKTHLSREASTTEAAVVRCLCAAEVRLRSQKDWTKQPFMAADAGHSQKPLCEQKAHKGKERGIFVAGSNQLVQSA